MTLFLAKLTLTPLIMYLTSAAGRRWGPGVSGWLTGLPLLAGPVSVFVCIEQGTEFAVRAAGGTLLGMWSSCAFCLAYHSFAHRGWVAASVAAVIAFADSVALLSRIEAAFSAVAADTDLEGRVEVVAPRNAGATVVAT